MKEYIRHQRGRMFQSDFFEFFSKVHPAIPFAFWLPICAAILGFALVREVTALPYVAVFFLFGFFGWQLLEYFIHKKIFHLEGTGPMSRRFHDIVHGFHHTYPDDDMRLVMPPVVSITVATAIALGLYFVRKPETTVPLWTGIVCGYLWYDFLHWSVHFRKPLTRWGKKLRSHHMAHHFANAQRNFGISNMWLDRLLGTLQTTEAKHKS